jgi:plastocyanin
MTPVFDASAASTLTLDFYSYIDDYAGGYTCKVLVDDGGGFVDVTPWTNPIAGSVGPGTYSIDISAFISSTVQLMFEFDGYYIDIDDWWIDDVDIYGYEAGAMTPPDHVYMNFDFWFDIEWGYDYLYIEAANCPCDTIDDWHTIDVITGYSLYDYYGADDDGWIAWTEDLVFPGMGTEICVRFRLESDASWNMRGAKIDNLEIPGIFGPDPMDNMNNWCTDILHYGQFWEYDDVDNQWCTDFPAVAVEDGLIWSTEINNAYEAYLVYETEYSFGTYAEGRVQVSGDGGSQWYTLDVLTGTSAGWETYQHNLNYYVGGPILIRFLALGGSPSSSSGHWCVKNVQITGKKDTMAPSTTAQITGTQTDAGWFNSAVTVTITATDVGAGMGDIHYILDGTETVKAGTSVTFTVSGNGPHNIEYWGVDKVGNEETPHNEIPEFRIDAGSPPSVSITEPTTGLYLFGNKLLSLSKIFIIGAFNIEATASDAESGVYRVQFLLDGDVIAEDTEAPYSAYCAIKHSGAGVIKVIAEDFSGNSAEDTLDITYYKFL